jgi:uncharacterized membrane protein YphA (DoxX/SURF4 family)
MAADVLAQLPLVARWFVGFVLLFAGVSKLADVGGFKNIIEHYGLIPSWALGGAARTLPAAECLIGVALVSGVALFYAAFAAAALFCIFGAAVAVNIVRGKSQIPCGCFGTSKTEPANWKTVTRSIAFAGMAWFANRPSALALNGSIGARAAAEKELPAALVALAVLVVWRLAVAYAGLQAASRPARSDSGRS